jgi:hypothetical protein
MMIINLKKSRGMNQLLKKMKMILRQEECQMEEI